MCWKISFFLTFHSNNETNHINPFLTSLSWVSSAVQLSQSNEPRPQTCPPVLHDVSHGVVVRLLPGALSHPYTDHSSLSKKSGKSINFGICEYIFTLPKLLMYFCGCFWFTYYFLHILLINLISKTCVTKCFPVLFY